MISPYRAFFLLLLPLLFAAERPILLLNSDASIEKYNLVAKEFQGKFQARPIQLYDLQQKPMTASELEDLILDLNPPLVFCIGAKALNLTSRFNDAVPVLFTSVINWQRFQRSRASFGIANEVSSEVQVILFKYLFPSLQTIGVLYSQDFNQEWYASATVATRDMKLKLVGQAVRSADSLEEQLDRLLPKVDALWLISDPVVLSDKDRMEKVFAMAQKFKKPIFTYDSAYVDMGPTLIISIDQPTLGRQAARIANQILTQQGNNTIEDPVGTYVIINMRKIKDYQILFNPDALDSVNQILE